MLWLILDYVEKIPVVYYKGDVSIEEDLDRPFQGASIVIHTAAIVSVGHHVDRNQMRSVNVIGKALNPHVMNDVSKFITSYS